jgi:hypothetical protein
VLAGSTFAAVAYSDDAVPFRPLARDWRHHADASGDEAIAAGWSEIDYAPGLAMANFIGICPDCLESFERWPVADDRIE